jgi:SNF2 family DNA or RNA helicase
LAVYTPSFKPRAKQQEALDKMEGKEAFALLMAMRTGKTFVLLTDFGRLELNGQVDDLFVIGPGGALGPWGSEDALKHLSADLRKRLRIHSWASGPNKGQQQALKEFLADTTGPRLFLMNVEALSSVKDARLAAIAFLKSRRTMLAIDESVILKNPSSKRTKFINSQLSPLAEWRRILSGLPTPRSPLDIYEQFAFLDWKILNFRSFFAFRGRYAQMKTEYYGGRTIQQVVGFRDLDDLQRRIEPNSFRCLLSDCYDLPEKEYLFWEVEQTPEQKRLYKEMKDFATAELKAMTHVTATVVVAQIIRLHQILLGHTVDEQGVEHAIPENRVSTLLERLEPYDGKAVIWVQYQKDVINVSSALIKEYGAHSTARFWGGNVANREQEEQRFKFDPACRWMVATASAGGRGREWSIANLVVYFSCGPDLDFRSQSEERAQAVGKNNPVVYADMIVKGTVEEKFIKILREKIDLAAAVTGDAYLEWLI